MSYSDAIVRYDEDRVACFERFRSSGIDLSQYDNSDIADDVRDLAFALKLPRIALRGSTDLARTALVVIRRYPGLLEAVLMNNANVPPFSTLTGLLNTYDQSLALLARRCNEDALCKAAMPNGLVSAVDGLREQFAANPQQVTVPIGNGRTEVLLEDGRFMVTLAIALLGAEPATLASIPSLAARGDPTPIAAYFASNYTFWEVEQSAANIIEWCAEDAGKTTNTLREAQAAALPRWRKIVDPGALNVRTIQPQPGTGSHDTADVADPGIHRSGCTGAVGIEGSDIDVRCRTHVPVAPRVAE